MVTGNSHENSQEKWEEAKKICDAKQAELLSQALNDAKLESKLPVFYAVYFQEEFEDGRKLGEIKIPFVIAQIPGAKDDLERCLSLGLEDITLEAKFFELGDRGRIRGKISPSKVTFTKQYKDREGDYKPDKIAYEGDCLENGIYQGTWTLGNLKGKFRMVRDSAVL